MSNRIDVTVSTALTAAQTNGYGTSHYVQTPAGNLYCIFIDAGTDLSYRKSTNGGLSWGDTVVIYAGTITQMSIWYDRWSNISAGLIHCAFSDSGNDDTMYRTIDTESSDALSTQTVIFAGASTATGCHLSITRAVGGNVYCKTVIDAGAEGGFYRLPNANVPNGAWDAARTVDEAIASGDRMILQPDFDAADTQDIMAFFLDVSANEISRKLYDDSANTWAETSILGSVTSSGSGWPIFAAAPDIGGTQSVLIAWNAIDGANADLKCWTVDSGTITACTDVVTNGTDDQGMAAIAIDTVTGYWHAFYVGKSDGSETYGTSVNVYTKVSMDSGSTWGPETLITNQVRDIRWIGVSPRFSSAFGQPPVAYLAQAVSATRNDNIMNIPLPRRRASHQLYGG